MDISTIIEKNSVVSLPQRLPLGTPIKIVIVNEIKNKESARRTMGKHKKGGSEVGAGPLSFPFPSFPARTIFLSPNYKKGPLRRREPDTREGD